jgi:hypothetical protein
VDHFLQALTELATPVGLTVTSTLSVDRFVIHNRYGEPMNGGTAMSFSEAGNYLQGYRAGKNATD